MAEAVVEGDDRVDELYHQIDDRLLLILATQSPVAVDLRAVVTMMRINHELERDADLMVNVAKTTRRIYPHELDPKVRGIIDRMGIQSSNQTRLAIDAFADSDPSWAAALSDMDDTMDELTKSLFRHILAWGASDEATVLQAVQVALVGAALRADRRPRGDDRRAGAVHGDRHPPRRDRGRRLTRSPERSGASGGLRGGGLFVAEVPVEDEVLALGVAHDPLAVAPELRVVGREQLQAGQRPLAEVVDELTLAEHPVDLPVRGDRAQVDHPDVSDRGELLDLFGLLGHGR